MAKALDRVKAAEARYTGMIESAEKLQATLKQLAGDAARCKGGGGIYRCRSR